MSNLDDLMNQAETAQYCTEHGIPLESADITRLKKFGAAPPCQHKGGQNLFYRADVDAWLENEKTRRDVDNYENRTNA